MKVYLVGYMGSGKSTVGKLLSELLKLDFMDFDRNIEQGEKKTIAEIFDEAGEEKFRQLEHDYLKKILPLKNIVVSLGGGTPCFHNNMGLINQNGITVFLDMDVDSLAQRLLNARNKRPLIRGLNEMELRLFIEANLEKRMPVYNLSKHTIQVKGKKAEEIAHQIRSMIEPH